MEYARRIRARREALKLTQRDLAERSGVKQPLISAIESGKREPSSATRAALEQALTVRPSEVLRLLREEALAVIERHRGGTPLVFGSVARGTDSPESDLDLLVTFAEDAGRRNRAPRTEEPRAAQARHPPSRWDGSGWENRSR